MPPKPQVFKAKDGKEFATRAEWRDYMMATFYSFKNVKDAPEPLVKVPGDVDGQMFDIADSENSTLVIMDNCEQVQIDQVKNCRIFIGACASSIFIRNCENCVFYTCCRQLRLREVTNSTFYIYSMAEVHIEYSNTLKFAPFNGGYPEHANHLRTANLDGTHNLWYDIFDHNDPAKTHANWSLLPEAEYEDYWFPAGAPCEPAVPRSKAGSVPRPELATEAGMQSFGFDQMVSDAQNIHSSAAPSSPPKAPPAASSSSSPVKPPQPVSPRTSPAKIPAPAPAAAAAAAAADQSDEDKIKNVVVSILSGTSDDISSITSPTFQFINSNGSSLTANEVSIVTGGSSVSNIEQIVVSSTMAFATLWVSSGAEGDGVYKVTGVFVKNEGGGNDGWKCSVLQRSSTTTTTTEGI